MTSRLPVWLVEHDPAWAESFRQEAAVVAYAFGSDALAVEHVGSTAVPGIRAKPIIDILVGVRGYDSFPRWRKELQAIGYDYTPQAEEDEPARKVFRKGPVGPELLRTHHLHVTEFGGAYWSRILAFRDHLRVDVETAREYEDLKLDLARRFKHDGRAYTAGKGPFVQAVEAQALADDATVTGA